MVQTRGERSGFQRTEPGEGEDKAPVQRLFPVQTAGAELGAAGHRGAKVSSSLDACKAAERSRAAGKA